MDQILNELKSKDSLTRADIAKVLASMKGKSKDEKKAVIKELTEAVGKTEGHGGVKVHDSLDDYKEYGED